MTQFHKRDIDSSPRIKGKETMKEMRTITKTMIKIMKDSRNLSRKKNSMIITIITIQAGVMRTMIIIMQAQDGIVTTKKRIIIHGEIITTIIQIVVGIPMVTIIIKEEMTSGIRIKPVIQIITPEVGAPMIQEIITITVVGTPTKIQIQIGITITTIIVVGVPKIK
jgi:hypothetical protein